MSHEKLKWMKDCLLCTVENQLCHLDEVDTEELGDAIDMIKDLEEAIYYCTVTEAMNKQGREMHMEMKKGNHQGPEDDRMYYSGYPMYYADTGHVNSGNGTSNTNSSNGRNYYDEPMQRDAREGRSYNSRRMYMEAKHMNKDKATQLRELEKYMQELSQDVTEMIADASPEEKQYLEKKITALASKIG
jgi:hypothetical protein